jgi:glycerophosphoryl diester phosphodiesterase
MITYVSTDRRRSPLLSVVLVGAALTCAPAVMTGQPPRKLVVAHRGASAYAPEHTLASYRLALEQRADFVEQDLQISKDGVLVCLHDLTLERTTNVEEVFPTRSVAGPNGRNTWNVSDFTLPELKTLDAGSWFDPKFAGERIPTLQEAIDLVKGKAGLYPETKGPEVYGSRGFDMEKLLLDQLRANKLDGPGGNPMSPVIIQSFSAESLQKIRKAGSRLPLTFLVSDLDPERGQWLTDAGLKRVRQFADGLGPAKALLLADPTLAARAHSAGLTLTPYTFRTTGTPAGKTVKDEMSDFLYRIGVDALFTDNPDQFPRR